MDLIFHLQEGRAQRTAQIRGRMQAPLPQSTLLNVAETIRRGGPGSIQDQFRRQAETGMRSSSFWKRTQPFGRRPAPARTLRRTGSLEAAWLGTGAASITETSRANTVRVGVDARLMPQAAVFQRSGITVIQVTPKMRLYVGANFGVWMKRSTTRIKVEGRPVALNRDTLGRARKIVQGYYLHGEGAATAVRKAA